MFEINGRVYEVAVIADDYGVQVTLLCDQVPVGEITADAITGESSLFSGAAIEAGSFDISVYLP
tara:strand:- start:1920 stop:2111 length:192 start_codon:yes stop_codon:yes gene_type:complete